MSSNYKQIPGITNGSAVTVFCSVRHRRIVAQLAVAVARRVGTERGRRPRGDDEDLRVWRAGDEASHQRVSLLLASSQAGRRRPRQGNSPPLLW